MACFAPIYERNQEATIYVGNCDPHVNEEILWELFLQCGPVVSVQMPRDKITGDHQGYGFVEFKTEEDADYSIKIMHLIKLHGKPIKVNKASQDKRYFFEFLSLGCKKSVRIYLWETWTRM
jgi:splicing factor 3B subunit 4